MSDEQERVERVALAIWQAREETFPLRLRRMKPDDMDSASGTWALVMRQARAALSAFHPLVGEKEGWVLVPREPTDDMLQAGFDCIDLRNRSWLETLAISYRAMIEASPSLPGEKLGADT